jgi:Na+/melibiose symporter-like transporter
MYLLPQPHPKEACVAYSRRSWGIKKLDNRLPGGKIGFILRNHSHCICICICICIWVVHVHVTTDGGPYYTYLTLLDIDIDITINVVGATTGALFALFQPVEYTLGMKDVFAVAVARSLDTFRVLVLGQANRARVNRQ